MDLDGVLARLIFLFFFAGTSESASESERESESESSSELDAIDEDSLDLRFELWLVP